MMPKLKVAAVLFLWTLTGRCVAGPLGDATASRRHAIRTNVGGGLQVGRTLRSGSLDEKPHVVHPVSKDPTANIPEKEQVINTPNEGSLRDPPSRYQLPQTVSSPKPPEQNDPKPQVVNLSHEQVDNLAEKPQVLFGSEREPVKNLGEKPQVVNPDVDPVGNYKEKPNTLKATYPDVARSIDRRIGSPIKDTSTKIQERPQVPPRVPLPARPYGERDPVPQIPVPPSQSTISNAHRPPYGGNKPDHPGPPRWPAYPRPPFGYGVPVGNIQVPTTPKPPSCFYKSERYEHGDSVETPEPCLNCTCQKGVLVCYLRVCPTIGTPAPGCFTAREAGQCCPSVFCSGDKKSETTTTPPPPTDDDYYDYPATIDYDTDTTTTTTTTTTRRPVTTSTRRYSFAPRPFNRPYASGIDEVELSARTPSVIVEQTEQSTTAEVDVTTVTTDLPSTTTTTTEAATQVSSEATTARRPITTFTPTTTTQQQSAGTSTTPEDVVVTVTAMGINPTATTSLPVETTTASVDLSGSDHRDKVGVTTPSDPSANRPNSVQRPAPTESSTPTTRAPSTTATAMELQARTPAKPFGDGFHTTKRPDVIEGGPKVVVAATTTTTTTGGSTTVASSTASPFDSNEALADAGYVAGTASPNEVEAPVRKPLTDDEPVNSVEDALQGGGRDSIMFVSSTPMPFELHHSFDLQDLNTVSGACLDEASLYAEGSAMLSSNFCNYCYCIRGLKRCVQPKCHLAVEDCEPQFTSQYDCCPASYACTQGPNATTPLPPQSTSSGPTTARTTTTTTTTTSTTTTTTEGPVVIPIQGCWKKGKLYRVGESIPGTKDCETCFCSPRGPLCERIECPPVALDCEPVIPQGHCCPTEYICNKTQVRKDIDYQVDGADKSIHHPQASSHDGHMDSQLLPRKSDDTLDYNSVPQPAYRPPTTQETPLFESEVETDKTTAASHMELPSHTTTAMPVTRFAPTPVTREKQPVFLATNNDKQSISTRPPFESSSPKPTTETGIGGSISEEQTKASRETSGEKKTAVYRPAFPQMNTGKRVVNESKTEANGTALPSLSLLYRETANLNDSTTKHLQQDIDNADRLGQQVPPLDSVSRSPPAMPQEGLQFSDLIDRVFFPGKDDKKESGDVNLQAAQLSPVYSQAHIYNATSIGASVIEARYPVKENDTLQPVYGMVPAYHRPTAESSIGEAGSLKPLYGKPPSFREESSDELISQMRTQVSTTAEVHYEPASSLDADMPSTNKSLVVVPAKNSTVESSKPQSVLSHQNDTMHEQGKRPHISIHPLELTPIYYDVRKYTTTTRRPSTTPTTAGSDEKLSTMTTSGTTVFVHRTSNVVDASAIYNESHTTKEAPEPLPGSKTTAKPDYNIWELMYFNRSVSTVKPIEASNTTETNIWKVMFFNQTSPTAEPAEVDNATYSSNEIIKKISPEKPAEEVGFTTSVIKVRVGNTLNVSVDSSNQSKYRNVEEDGIIVSVYPEHQMDGEVSDLQDMPLQGQAESRAISSGSPYKGIQHSGDKAKSPAELTQVISDIIKAHKSDEPEVITAPNIDFSKQGVMTVKVTPSNSFKVFSLVLLDKNGTNKHGTTSTTEPPVDTAPWAPMGSSTEDPSFAKQHSAEYNGRNVTSSGTLSSTESYESQASLTIQTKQLPTVASSETVEHPEKPELHSTFRIVPFLAEDAIFRPAIPAQPSMINNNTGAYHRIVNTDPRDTVEDNCFVGGHLYVNGEMIKKGNPCELCRCYYGRELCQQKNCPLPPSPACISEAVPGFCCPKYTCRPEDVYFPPDPETTPSPDNLVQQYTVNVWSARNPTRHAGFAGPHGNTQQPGHTSRKSTSPWPTTSSFFLKNSPTLKPYLLQRRPVPQEQHDRYSHLYSTEESGSYEETTPPPPTTTTTTTTEPPLTPQSPSSSQHLWNIFQVSGCNIYGRLYGVNEVVRELSSKCKACTCTSLGVQCNETC